MNREEIKTLLYSLDLFKGCEGADVPFTKRLFDRGDAVCDNVDGVPCVGLVVSGDVDVLPSGCPSAMVSTLCRGDLFGICNILVRREMPTRLVCKKHAVVAYITKDDFVGLMCSYPDFALRYATLCNEKIMFLAQRVAFANLNSAEEKLRVYLCANASDRTVTLVSKEDLARRLGISHAALFRELNKLQKTGKITVENNLITLSEDF